MRKRSKASSRKSRPKNKSALIIVAICVLVVASVFALSYKDTNVNDSDLNDANLLTISTGTQGHFEDLFIGLGNIQNNSAYVYLNQRKTNETSTRKVSAGDKFEIYGYIIEVKSINKSFNPSLLIGASHGNIKLKIEKK